MLALTVALPLLIGSTPLPPSPGLVDWKGVHPLRYHLAADATATGVAWTAWLLTETVLKKSLAPASCRWCERGPDGTDQLNGLDGWGRGMRGAYGALPAYDMASNVGLVVVPLVSLGLNTWMAHDANVLEAAPVDALLVLEAIGWAQVLNQGVKVLVGRERPFVHALPDDQKPLTKHPLDNNASFFSGHATFAFAAAVGAGTIAELRGYRHSTYVWAVGLPLAATVGLLRMAADKHYLSDVFLGALFGAGVGAGMPLLLHGRLETKLPALANVRLVAGPGGVLLSARF